MMMTMMTMSSWNVLKYTNYIVLNIRKFH